MADAQVFHLDDPAYIVCELQPEQTEPLQRLFEQCADYALVVDGEGVSPTAAREIFQSLPAGRSLSDKFLYGLLDQAGNIVGVLEGIRHYPDDSTWWIGLLLLAPEVRGHGLGRMLTQGLSDLIRSERGTSIMLGVVEENRDAYRFWQQLGFVLVRQTEPRQFGRKVQTVNVMRLGVA